MNELQEDKHYTVKEMAELFGVSRSKLDRLTREGKLKKIKFGRTTLFNAQDVRQFLAANNP